MTDIQAAIHNFLAQFGLPVWCQDTVPDNAELPYITFQPVNGEMMSATVLVFHNWHRDNGQGVNAERAAAMDRIAQAIPPRGGIFLPVPGRGYMTLYRNGGSFQTTVQDEEDKTIIGGRTSLEVHFYLN